MDSLEQVVAVPISLDSRIMTDPIVHSVSEGAGSTSLSLLERVRSKDQRAWERLVSLYTPLVDRWCRRDGLQDADTADVRQKVFMAVADHIGEFKREETSGTFRGWLRTITRNKVCDHWRTEATKAATGGSDAYAQLLQVASAEPEDVPAGVESEDAGVLYRRAVELIATDFEERTWKAFWMVVVEDRLPVDAAAELGMSANAVYLAKARVLARLREEFAGLIDQ
jgi:RNA polymerase sigma-70 factor (ECF subfamily)